MRLPIYLITESEGIPIPGSTWVLDVPSEMQPYFKSHLVGDKHQLIIGISNHYSPAELVLDLTMLSMYTSRIALLCSVHTVEDSGTFLAVTLSIEERVYIRELEQVAKPILDLNEIIVTYEELEEEFQPDEESVVANLIKVEQNVILENENIFPPQMIKDLNNEDTPIKKMNIIADYTLKSPEQRVEYIQSESHVDRLDIILKQLTENIDKLDSIQVDQDSKRIIKRASKPRPHNAESIKARFKLLDLPEDTRDYIQREVTKLDSLPKSSNEHSLVLDYMTWILELPWNTYSYKDYELSDLMSDLDKSHHGLANVKEHILEHMTIEKIKGSSTGTILCFIGPPGTGKTSIAKEIATVTGRKLVRIAMGGLSDEAEIRGHRRTYQGSRPGRIVTGLKKAGAMDALFLLDEIDKITIHKGDPYSALLEVLDKEQQDHFIDRYLEVPLDLSKAMFICTANYEQQIPEALRDRIEFIHFKQYDQTERATIAEDYLIPKAINDLGLGDYNITFTDEAIDKISNLPNVRSINRRIHKLLRMSAVDLVVKHEEKIIINLDYLLRLAESKKTKTKLGF